MYFKRVNYNFITCIKASATYFRICMWRKCNTSSVYLFEYPWFCTRFRIALPKWKNRPGIFVFGNSIEMASIAAFLKISSQLHMIKDINWFYMKHHVIIIGRTHFMVISCVSYIIFNKGDKLQYYEMRIIYVCDEQLTIRTDIKINGKESTFSSATLLCRY